MAAKRSLTLLELMTAMCILTMLAGLLIYKGHGLVKKHRQDLAHERYLDEVELTKLLAFSYNGDVKLEIKEEEGGIRLTRMSEEIPKDLLGPSIFIPDVFSIENKKN